MNKTIAAALMSAFLFMGSSCPWTGIQISGPAVIALVQQTCGIIVPLADISALVVANPGLVSVVAVVEAICGAFKTQMAAAGGQTASPSGHIIVSGVLVHYVVK
jgi:hypothetical protein